VGGEKKKKKRTFFFKKKLKKKSLKRFIRKKRKVFNSLWLQKFGFKYNKMVKKYKKDRKWKKKNKKYRMKQLLKEKLQREKSKWYDNKRAKILKRVDNIINNRESTLKVVWSEGGFWFSEKSWCVNKIYDYKLFVIFIVEKSLKADN